MSRTTPKLKKGFLPFPLVFIIAVMLDLLDLLIVGLIPVLGLVIDIAGAGIIFLGVGFKALLFTVPEFVDVATLSIPILLPVELFPSYTVAALVGKFALK